MRKTSPLISLSILLFIITIALNIRYPNNTSYGENLFFYFGFDSKNIGIFLSIIVGIGLIIMTLLPIKRSTRILLIVFILIVVSISPSLLVKGYQTYFANGIYALEYDKSESDLSFTVDRDMLRGECNLRFINHSDKRITFYVSFDYVRENSLNTFLEKIKPIDNYKLTIEPKEDRNFNIPIKSNISFLPNESRIGNGSVSRLNLIISDGSHKRDL